MKKTIYSLLLIAALFGCKTTQESQDVSIKRNVVGSPLTGNNYEACDTITGERVLYDILNSDLCDCYSIDGNSFVPRSCDNVVIGACDTKQFIDRNCNEKRTFTIGYDNGLTPGSSTNDCGARVNFIRFSWPMEVLGWEVNGTVVGQGYVFPASSQSGWTPQLQGWSDFFNLHDPNITDSEFGFNPRPTWRYAEVFGCDPNATYGALTLRRTDTGCEYKVYPVLDSEKKERIYDYSCIVDDQKVVNYCYPKGTEWIDTTGIDSLECLMPCGYDFSDIIQEGAVSNCVETFIDYACDFIDQNTTVQLAIVINDCDGERSILYYELNDYINASDPDVQTYEIQGEIKNCDGTDFEFPPIDPACSSFEITYIFGQENVTGTLRNREWDLGSNKPLSYPLDSFIRDRENFDLTSTTTVDANWNGGLSVNDSNSSNTVQDGQVIDGFIVVTEDRLVRWTGGSYGYFALEIGLCCGESEIVVENRLGGGNGTITDTYTFTEGIHSIAMWNIDDYANTARNLEYSTDGGTTWITDNTPPGIKFSREKPIELCKKVKECEDANITIDYFTGELVDKSTCYPKSISCDPVVASNQAENGIDYKYCHNGSPVIYCIEDKKHVFYQNGELLENPVFHDCLCPPEVSEGSNYSVNFKSSGIQQIVTDCGTWNGNYDFQSPLAPPQSSNDVGSQMQQAKISIDSWLSANGGGTVHLEYISTSILEITITGSTCAAVSANDDSNPGPHNFTQI